MGRSFSTGVGSAVGAELSLGRKVTRHWSQGSGHCVVSSMAWKSTAKLRHASIGRSWRCAKAAPSRPAARPCVRGRARRS
eukprot:7487127-Alexandrium_andersonii.AAC.1